MVKQAARQNHTDNHTRAHKWLGNGINFKVIVVQILSLRPTKHYKKDIMPANGFPKPLVGINLLKIRKAAP